MAQRERLTPAILMTATVALTVSIIVACSGGNPAGPESTDSGPGSGDGKVTAACPGCFPGPVPVPGGPGPAPVPGGPGGPTGGPTPNPSASPSPGSSPTPNPSASPTPPTTCPVSVLTKTFSGEFSTTGGGNGPSIAITDTNLANCEIARVRRVNFQAQAADFSASIADDDWAVGFFHEGVEISFWLIQSGTDGNTPPAPMTGMFMGSSCSDISFQADGGNFRTATAPYSGVWKPYGDTFDGTRGTYDVFTGQSPLGTWTLPLYRIEGEVIVQCFELEFALRTKTAP